MVEEEGRGHFRASYADREHAIEMLKAAFTQDRLAKDEFEARVGQAFAARIHAELAAVTADIPAPVIPDRPPSISTRVREQRTRREISQAELASVLGVSRQTVISIESGQYLPSLPLAFHDRAVLRPDGRQDVRPGGGRAMMTFIALWRSGTPAGHGPSQVNRGLGGQPPGRADVRRVGAFPS